MARVQVRAGQRAVFMGTVLGMTCCTLMACETAKHARVQPSIVTTDPDLSVEIQHLPDKLSPKDRAAMEDEILEREDVLVHVITGDLSAHKSRGGASSPASSEFSRTYCKEHPQVDGVPWNRDWDLVVDRRVAEAWANKCGIPNPPDVVIYHEIFGHIRRVLKSPRLLRDAKIERLKAAQENQARIIENQYRTQRGLEEVPEHMEPCFP